MTGLDKRYRLNRSMRVKLFVVVVAMVGFGYALVPFYNAICEATGINVLALLEQRSSGQEPLTAKVAQNAQVDASRTITIEFDANVKHVGGAPENGIWAFKPAVRSMQVHPGELSTVMYEFQNTQPRRVTAQAIPSYAPRQSQAYFNKVACFCFNQYTLQPGEKRIWPVVFVIDPKLPEEIKTITLSYTFFEVPGKGSWAGAA